MTHQQQDGADLVHAGHLEHAGQAGLRVNSAMEVRRSRPLACGTVIAACGWRHVEATDQPTAVDHAAILKDLLHKHFPDAAKIVPVEDNLNTHRPVSLYEVFPTKEARRLVERFEGHYTRKHGSWLNIAEPALRVVSCQCLDRRIPDKQTLIEEVAAWEGARKKNHAKADWHFTTADSRIELKGLYPSF